MCLTTKGTTRLMLRGTAEVCLQHVHLLIGTFRVTRFLAKSIETGFTLSLHVKYVCAAQIHSYAVELCSFSVQKPTREQKETRLQS